MCTINFPHLPIFDSVNLVSDDKIMPVLNKTVLVCVQHLLETTGSLFEILIANGLSSSNIYVSGKAYSTNADVAATLSKIGINVTKSTIPSHRGYYAQTLTTDIQQMWEDVVNFLSDKPYLENIFILDDGGYGIKTVPESLINKYRVIGIEQTTSGIKYNPNITIPVVEVATSATKKLIEPYIIVDTIIKKTFSAISSANVRIGVAGVGSIGAELMRQLVNLGMLVNVYDKSSSVTNNITTAQVYHDISEFFAASDVIFGCSGEDITHDIDTKCNSRNKTLISCSSSDIEFLTLLRNTNYFGQNISQDNIFGNVLIKDDSSTITIKSGGFPVNFDRSRESVPGMDIQLTRALLFAGIIQAAKTVIKGQTSNSKKIMLCPDHQKMITNAWFDLNPMRRNNYENSILDIFSSCDDIYENSL